MTTKAKTITALAAAVVLTASAVFMPKLLAFAQFGAAYRAPGEFVQIPGTNNWWKLYADSDTTEAMLGQIVLKPWMPVWVLNDDEAQRLLTCNLRPCKLLTASAETLDIVGVYPVLGRDDMLRVATSNGAHRQLHRSAWSTVREVAR